MLSVLSEFVQILVGAIEDLAVGVAGGVAKMASALFLETSTDSTTGAVTVTGLSIYGGIVAIFAGLALAIAITTRVFTWITSLGN